MDYNTIRIKVNELNRSTIQIVDMLTPLENGEIFGASLTQAQIGSLLNKLKSEADSLKTIAGEIKLLVS